VGEPASVSVCCAKALAFLRPIYFEISNLKSEIPTGRAIPHAGTPNATIGDGASVHASRFQAGKSRNEEEFLPMKIGFVFYFIIFACSASPIESPERV
jgi:hypothetical protein